jgi:hypothetical protein
MALDESVDGLEELMSNGITAYIDGSVKEFVEQQGGLHIDFVDRGIAGGGYTVTVGQPGQSSGCDTGSCGSC